MLREEKVPELDEYLERTKPKDGILALMAGTVAAWIGTNNYGYERVADGSLQVAMPDFAVVSVVAVAVAGGLTMRMVRNWRIVKFYKVE